MGFMDQGVSIMAGSPIPVCGGVVFVYLPLASSLEASRLRSFLALADCRKPIADSRLS